MSSSTEKVNRRAIVSLVLSLASAVLVIGLMVVGLVIFDYDSLSFSVPLAILLALSGAVVGHTAKRQIRETGEAGRGIAHAGVIIGWVFIVALVLLVGFVVVVAASWLLTPGW